MPSRLSVQMYVLLFIGAAGCSAGHIEGVGGDAGGDPPVGDANEPPIDGATPHIDAHVPPPGPDAQTGPCESPNPGTRTAPAFGNPTVSTNGLLIRVMNNCPFPLWIHGAGSDGNGGTNVLQPDQAQLAPGAERDYDAHTTLGSARVTAFRDGPGQNEIQFIELNYGDGQLGYNISYVDYIGLPVEADGQCGKTACYAPVGTLFDGCPAQLHQNGRCYSAGSWCTGNAGDPYCKALDQTAQAALALPQCQTELAAWQAQGHAQSPIGTTPSVYGCRDFWAASPFCCSVVNRGMVGAADPYEVCKFYQSDPFNTYAKWVHQRCPAIYAFPYDDAGEQGGYHQCATKELRVTWCPGG